MDKYKKFQLILSFFLIETVIIILAIQLVLFFNRTSNNPDAAGTQITARFRGQSATQWPIPITSALAKKTLHVYVYINALDKNNKVSAATIKISYPEKYTAVFARKPPVCGGGLLNQGRTNKVETSVNNGIKVDTITLFSLQPNDKLPSGDFCFADLQYQVADDEFDLGDTFRLITVDAVGTNPYQLASYPGRNQITFGAIITPAISVTPRPTKTVSPTPTSFPPPLVTSTPIPLPTDMPTPAYTTRQDMCLSLAVSSSSLNVGQSVTLSSMTKPNYPANTFSYAFYNLDNVVSPGNPKPVCVTTGGDDTSVTAPCPSGSHQLIYWAPNMTTRNLASRTLMYTNAFPVDTQTGKQVKRVQINAYFRLGTNPTSLPNIACVRSITSLAPTLTPTAIPLPTLTPQP